MLSLLILLVLSTSIAFSMATNGKALQIANSSKNDLFLEVNNTCLKDHKINARSIRAVPKNTLLKECKNNLTSCAINVYLNNNCQDRSVTLFTLDVAQLKIMKVAVYQDTYNVSANGPYLFIEGPWV